MKKILILLSAVLSFTACTNNENLSNSNNDSPDLRSSNTNATGRHCPSEDIRKEALKNNQVLRARFVENERQAEEFSQAIKLGKVLPDGSVEVPVVFNIIYSLNTDAENLSESRLQEQIDVLNQDYSATNPDVSKIPAEFKTVAANDTKVRFKLAKIVRKFSPILVWAPTGDLMKRSITGGIDATDPSKNLNFWAVRNMGSVLGYATFPESAGQWNDGIVVTSKYIGKAGATDPFNLGRTATHEVGHYLNLRHIWGDANCGDDFCDDTPTQPSSNSGKPNYPLYGTCGGVQRSLMFMNYMDYVDDAAMFMFSNHQKERMQAVVAPNGPRVGLR
ncbi:peptidase M43 [Chryseobacterium piperi]|uniref:Peptidase M43 n=1 Tax=Chryseobacterium piperi TaxID=558152 RepID=A0A086BK37_9FLAO|nr:zinc metalloprotease [Chryseobacterium piperi]ASW73858.1 zinc metalloprotease [Chryseobacterium piperi]KFF29301.1 peptidase M43 [Chryseobacterium piperi]